MELKDVSLADAMILFQNNVISSRELKDYMEVKAMFIRNQLEQNRTYLANIRVDELEKGDFLK